MLAVAVLSACNPISSSQAEPKDQIVGRWESPNLSRHGESLYAQFNADGNMKYMGGMGEAMSAEWLFLDSGELQVTTNGNAHRCNATIDGKNLTIVPPACMSGWDEVGNTVTLVKQ